MSATNLLAPGSILGNYQIIEPIAQGGMGVVYHARHRIMRREVALKVLFPHLTGDPEFTQRFEREGQAMAQLRHPNIVEVYDAASSDGYYYLAMELLQGGTLHQQLARLRAAKQSMPINEALDITRQIALALDYAHNKGLVHRDIKPSNILIASDGRYVLTDFGIVHTQDATKLTRAVTAMGTPEYMSPEQAQGQTVDGRSDLYSLGVVLYEMMAGRPPFSADTPWATVYQHVKEPPPPITRSRIDIPSPARDIVNKSLAKKPADRFQTGRQLAAAIDQILVVKSAGGGLNRRLILAGIVISLAIVIGATILAITTLFAANPVSSTNKGPNSTSAVSNIAQVASTASSRPPATVTLAQPAAPSQTAPPIPSPSPLATQTDVHADSATSTIPATPLPEMTASATAVTAAATKAQSGAQKPATPVPPTTAPPDNTIKTNALFSFEQPFTWRRGDQAFGELAQSTEQAHDGKASAKLAYNFPGSAADFVVFINRVHLPGQPTGMVAWVYGDGSGDFLNVWAEDNAGQVRQFTFGRINHHGWRQMVAWFNTAQPWPQTHISGPDSTTLAYPLNFYALVLDSHGGPPNGAIYIDEINVTTQPWPAVTAPTSPPAAQAQTETPGTSEVTPTPQPASSLTVCNQSMRGISNMCIGSNPVPRGGSTFAVWRIETGFKQGCFDKGEGTGCVGPIDAQMRVDITNIDGPRTITLSWIDDKDNTRSDSLTIQVQ